MAIKLTGIVLVFFSCAGAGFLLAHTQRWELRALEEFIRLLEAMEGELQTRLTPLPELCRRAAQWTGIYRQFFADYEEALNSQIAPDPGICMEYVLGKHPELPALGKKYLGLLGHTLGQFDLPGQLNQLRSLADTCRRELMGLEENKASRLRSYPVLGLCAGAALVILLL